MNSFNSNQYTRAPIVEALTRDLCRNRKISSLEGTLGLLQDVREFQPIFFVANDLFRFFLFFPL